MADTTIHFEALITETKTVFKYAWSIPKLMMPCMIPIDKKCEHDILYSTLLDGYLYIDDYNIIQDSTSTLGIFKLASDMYAMSDCHNIGFKQFDDAYLLIELFNADFEIDIKRFY